jgi:archaemetzincin
MSLKYTPPECQLESLVLETSSYAAIADYQNPNKDRLSATLSSSERNFKKPVTQPGIFPAPLVLPDDDLALDPEYPPQSLQDWLDEPERNKVTPKRNVVYVAAPPGVAEDAGFISDWAKPNGLPGKSAPKVLPPDINDILAYISAFYHGLNVRLLPIPLTFSRWSTKSSTSSTTRRKATPTNVALDTNTESIRIRTRSDPTGTYPRQLNLDDLLDVAISVLPKDAYALLCLVDHDLYEEDDDDFVCGRAYGGSRVAVVSTARYHPCLDDIQGIERAHAWPASHCRAYVERCCATARRKSNKGDIRPRKRKCQDSDDGSMQTNAGLSSPSPMQAALSAHLASAPRDSVPSAAALTGLWLGRICRTASHELGHCFGMDHCTHYACVMQGSASVHEDARQPPYLCPVDLAKVLQATKGDEKQRYRALLEFCEKRGSVQLFAAYAAWIRALLTDV